jgi:hypothetical protein
MAIVERRLLTAPEPVPTFDVTGWPSESLRRPPLRAVQNSQHVHFVFHLIHGHEGQRREHELARTIAHGQAGRHSGRCEGNRCRRRSGELSDVPNRDWSRRCSRRCVRGRPRRPSSSGRASAAIAPVHASHDIVVLEQSAVACGGATLLNLAAEPLVMVDRAGQQVERDLVD